MAILFVVTYSLYTSGAIWYARALLSNGRKMNIPTGIRTSSPSVRGIKDEEASTLKEVKYAVARKVRDLNMRFSKDTGIDQAWTLKEAGERYLHKVSPTKKSCKDDRTRMRKIIEYFGDMKIDDLTSQDIEDFLYQLEQRRIDGDSTDTFNNGSKVIRSKSTVRKYYELLRAVFYSVEEQAHFPKIKRRDLKQEFRKRTLNAEEEKIILKAVKGVDEELFRIVVIALCTGIRQGSIMGMRWRMINLDKGIFRSETSKSGRPITVQLNEVAIDILKQQKEAFPNLEDDLVWHWELFPRKQWTKAVKESGLEDFRFHDIRHTVLTKVAWKYGIAVAKDIAHHSCITMTEKYVNIKDKELRKAYDHIAIELPENEME